MARTLEEVGFTIAAELGHDPNDPNVQAQVAKDAASVRAELPGVDDETIITQHGDAIRQLAGQRYPAPAKAPTPMPAAAPAVQAPPPVAPGARTAAYQAGVDSINQNFSGEKEQEVRDVVNRRNQITEAGRTFGLGLRANASPVALAALNESNRADMAANAQPLQDWASKKAAAVGELERQYKAGQVADEDVRMQIMKLGHDQTMKEKATAEAYTAAINDPNSVHSQSLREIAKQKFPKFAAGLGDKYNTLTYAALVKEMPGLEKQFEKEMDAIQKQLDRDANSTEKQKDRDAKAAEFNRAEAGRNARAAAKLGAAGGTKPLKPGEALAFSKEEEKITEAGAAAQRTVDEYDRLEKLIESGKVSTGPIVGGKLVGSAVSLISPARQEAENIVKNIVGAASKTFGTNPTDSEREYIAQMSAVLQMDDPLPRLKQLRKKFEDTVAQKQQALGKVQAMRGAGPTSIAPADFDAQWAKLKSGQSLVGPDGVTYTKK